MSLEKKIDICIGTSRDKGFRARLSLMIVLDGIVINEHYHTISVNPGDDLIELKRVNDEALQNPSSGIPGAPWPKIPDDLWDEVRQHIGIIHKPAVIAAYRKKLDDQAEIAKLNQVKITGSNEKVKP